MAFCVGMKDNESACVEEALYCYSHASRISFAESKEKIRELQARLAELEAAQWNPKHWTQAAYAFLGHERDVMPPEAIEIVQKFLQRALVGERVAAGEEGE